MANVKKQEVVAYTLELTEREAQVLAYLTGYRVIGPSDGGSPRGITDDIYRSLKDAGVGGLIEGWYASGMVDFHHEGIGE